MRKLINFIFILNIALNITLLGGCGPSVSYNITKNYQNKIPKSIAVLPVRGEKAESDARHLFRVMAHEKLSQLNYNLLPLEAIDDKLTKANINRKEFLEKPPAEMAKLLGVDAVVYVTITNWSTRFLLAYASIDMEARFDMYAANTGERIWTAEYGHEESDTSIDKETLKIKITKIYEPMIQKVVDAAFSTLPSFPEAKKNKQEEGPKKKYFEWLQ
ncbi:MAG: DUF799 family lipoprotein [Deltaproteobacteria bacterium]|nr:DUF799 family lipoprotein [Deltaproteobacteria bacterium]